MTLLAFSSAFQTALNIFLAFVVLMFMILIHELGHYTAGKLLNFKINEFSVGMGPKLLSKKKANGEVFSLRAIPLGGFCAFESENEQGDTPQSFNNQKPWKRLVVLFSGAFFNFVSAIIIAVFVFSVYGDTAVKVDRVYEYAPQANQTFLQQEDIICQIDGREVLLAGDFSAYLSKAGDTFDMVVLRNGEYITLSGLNKQTYVLTHVTSVSYGYMQNQHTLQKDDQIYKANGQIVQGQGAFQAIIDSATSDTIDLVILTAQGEFVDFSLTKQQLSQHISMAEYSYNGIGMSIGYAKRTFSFGQALGRTIPYCFEVGKVVLRTLGQLVTGALGLEAVGGPISTIGLTSEVVASGFGNVLSLIVLISVNLAVFNLLPVPALDGCRMIFVIIEWIRGKPVNRRVEAYINGIGLILLFVLVIFIDLLKL